MATIEIDIMYDPILKGTIINTEKVDKGAYVLKTKPYTNVLIKYIIRKTNNLIIRVDMCIYTDIHI